MTAGVLVTGVYGVGKSSVVEEMADILEEAGLSYAALDLDWLWWFDVGGDRYQSQQVLLANTGAVVANYADAGVQHFVMALALRNRAHLDAVRSAVPFPLHVVRLTAPLALIEYRLSGAAASGRHLDLAEAKRWEIDGIGNDVGDLVVPNERDLRTVASDILDWLGWLGPETATPSEQ